MLVYPFFTFILLPLLYLLGYYARRLSSTWIYLLGGAALCIVLFRTAVVYLPGMAFQIIPAPSLYAHVEPFFAPAAGVFLLSLSEDLLGEERKIKAVRILSGLLFLTVFVFSLYFPLTDYDKLKGGVMSNGVCPQTTEWSCGPAAGVTFLHQIGIRAGEKELALSGPANSFTGMGPFQLWNSIQNKMKTRDEQPVLRSVTYRELKEIPMPAAAVIDFSFFVDHWIVLSEIRNETIVFMDPLDGKRETMKRQEFQDRWRGFVIYPEKQ